MTGAGREFVATGIGMLTPSGRTPAADTGAGRADWFDSRRELGRGYKYLPPACQYLLVATRAAVADSGGALEAVGEERRAVAVGSNRAIAAVHDGMDRTILESGSAELSPATAAYGAVNVLTGRVSVEHACKGFNLTLTTPVIAGLEALATGGRALRAGRSDVLIAGAMEEPPPPGAGTGRAEQGAIALLVETAALARRRRARGYGSIETQTLVLPATAKGKSARRLLDGSMARLGAIGLPVHTVLDKSPTAEMVRTALAGHPVAAEHEPGDGCLRAMAVVARLLAAGAEDCLVAAAAGTGTVALARVRRWDRGDRSRTC
ncbi:beta-ketoacyl synthase N-terminal-like domain-containing protein [Amycolatopsis sp. YIM 10]|uniref:beta-ketoacyl synthase N-terminal-like domain-containing protein n=1 Tax=Amycolatopsis sp. YIM 10 TaxID=2653857 RepID=UPI0012A8503B|nr:beta-ketoacyl synthase N-terminal-like domain-containing protein [Amycolatopsis sp. YIM 10]QFU90546.1 3-oxoacyl-[acyl-carrier-protein] synthase 2 [Amycolatopsis sp. YIM 10]